MQEIGDRVVYLTGLVKSGIMGLLFIGLWRVMISRKPCRRDWIFFGVILAYLLGMEMTSVPAIIKYPLVMAAAILYCRHFKVAKWETPAFLCIFLYNLHVLSFQIAFCAAQFLQMKWQENMDLSAPDILTEIYRQLIVQQLFLMICYAGLLTGMVLLLAKIGCDIKEIDFLDFAFLSTFSIVAIFLVYIMLDLSVVKMEKDVFVLFEEKGDLMYKLPLIAILVLAGEYTGIYVWGRYRTFLEERQLVLAREEQLRQMKQRFEEADALYSDIRKLRHEMKNHVTIIMGMLAAGERDSIQEYVKKLDDAIDTIDYRFSTGDAVCDVILNEKYRRAAKCGTKLEVDFHYVPGIPDFDVGIVLSNLLDNALEACEKLPENERYVQLTGRERGPCILIEVRNSYAGKILFDEKDGLPVSSKEQGESQLHGIGLRNVKEITQLYMGSVQIDVQDAVFEIRVMMQKTSS